MRTGRWICYAMLVALSVGCSRKQQEEARAKAAKAQRKVHDEAERAGREARYLGHKALVEARTLERQLDQTKGSSGPGSGNKASAKLAQAAMAAKVKAKLASDVGLSTVTGVDVDTSGHVVTLRGTVSSESQKLEAERAASHVNGVEKVINDLKVQQ